MYFPCDLPAWYDIAINKTIIQLIIRSDAFQFFVENYTKYRLLSHMEEMSETLFISPNLEPNGEFGFGPICKYRPSEKEGWVLCEVQLPSYDESVSGRAQSCLFGLFSSLLFAFASQKKYWDCKKTDQIVQNPQLIQYDIMWDGQGMNDYGLSVNVSPALARWIAKQPEGRNAEMGNTILEVTKHMSRYISEQAKKGEYFSAQSYCRTEFGAYFGVSLTTDGDACDLGSGGAQRSNPDPESYVLGPHNVDCFRQQFSLFAGVAKMCEIARAEIG